MPTIKSLEEFKTWQKARKLNKELLKLTLSASFNNHINLRNQINSASVSVMANMAEGYGRQGTREFLQFLSISKASLIEVKSHLYAAVDVELIRENDFEKLISVIIEIEKMLFKLMRYLQNTPIKGLKYKNI